MAGNDLTTLVLELPDAFATDRLGQWFAAHLRPGDTFLLSGTIGAGKTHFARALIRSVLASHGVDEDVPSPTYTLVQTYPTPDFDIVHGDLYRLQSVSDLTELGLAEAFADDVTVIEWPDRLGRHMPADALRITLSATRDGSARRAELIGTCGIWGKRLDILARDWHARRD